MTIPASSPLPAHLAAPAAQAVPTRATGYMLPEYPFTLPEEIRLGETSRHEIVIVGGGITGLTLACSLANLGVKAVLLDEDNTVGVSGASSRGICYTQKSLEIFHKLGIYERIAAKGIEWSVGRTFAGADEVYSFDLSQQSAYNLSSQPPFINIQQFYIEAYLVDRIAELKRVELRWQSRVTAMVQDEHEVTLSVTTPAGDYQLKAHHVIDASGAHSPFRRWCDATVTAKKGDDRWCIADVRFSKNPPVERHTWVEAPFNENRAVWQHLMGDKVWRIDYQMAPNADPAWVSREDVVRDRLARQFGADAEIEIVWVGPYAYRSECIDQMRHGRVFFMGDSAKVVSPFGARGGNTGVSDADNLAWKLAAVLRQQAGPQLLDSYHQERHEAARENVKVTNRTARFLRPADGMERVFRDATIALAKQFEFAQKFVNTGRMAVANSYHFSSAIDNMDGLKAGFSLQNIAFQFPVSSRPDRRPVVRAAVLNDLLQWAEGNMLLLVFGPLDERAARLLRGLSQSAHFRAVQVLDEATPSRAVEHIIDRNAQGVHALRKGCQLDLLPPTGKGHATPAWAIIRPDGYLAASGAGLPGRLRPALRKAWASVKKSE